jgi:hypothetical protein
MPTRARKPPEDEVQAAFRVVREATEEKPAKNPAAVALGRLGAALGGKARAAKLSARRRREIARKAAAKRWAGHAKEESRKPLK